ncbi:MAG TPA: PAS domain S-box protein [Ktedonobacterales bacterium]|nr:PAS domain S-box protein [Ktedonobacterales bacterium]
MVKEHDRNGATPHQMEVQPRRGRVRLATHAAEDAAGAFRATAELAEVGICHTDLDGRFRYVNPALCQLTGYPHAALLGLTFRDIIHPDDVEETLAHVRRLLAGETPTFRLEQRFRRQDGAVIWGRANMALHRAASGTPAYVVATIEDITERKRLAEQLDPAEQTRERAAAQTSESQQQASDLAAIFEAITDLIVVFDTSGHVRQANRATRDFGGPHPTLEAGRQQLRLADVHGQSLPPDQWVSARVLRGEILTGDQAIDMHAYAGAGREVLFNVSGAPVRDRQGQIVGGVIVLRDVTERRRLERRTQDVLQALLQMAETLVALPSPAVTDSTTVSLPGMGRAATPALNPVVQRLAESARHVLGCQRVGLVALKVGSDIMHPLAAAGMPLEQVAAWCTGLQDRSMTEFIGTERMQALRVGEAVQLDLERQPLRGVAKGGPVALAVPLRLGDQLVGALALGYEHEPHAYTDDELALAGAVGQLAALIVERDRLLQEREDARAKALALLEANRRMDEFLSIAGHELRTPLTSLLGNLQVLARRLARAAGEGATQENLASQLHMVSTMLEQMDRQGWQLSRLVSDLVDASRTKAGALELRLQTCDLAGIVRQTVEEQRQAHPQRSIALALSGDAAALVTADADRVGQVVTNYLTNALKYSREDQPVEVRLSVQGGLARVTVRDYGPGLRPEEQPRIWELFHRAAGVEVQSGSGVGLGLGLHICKTIVERHGGQVGVESEVGHGATFWFTLPLDTDA